MPSKRRGVYSSFTGHDEACARAVKLAREMGSLNWCDVGVTESTSRSMLAGLSSDDVMVKVVKSSMAVDVRVWMVQ